MVHISKQINLKIKYQQIAEQWWRVKIQLQKVTRSYKLQATRIYKNLKLQELIIRKLNKTGKKSHTFA